ncbi:urease accessory protein UreE [Curvivirga sp.]|uniref:urease accessory protein UreE n=1 Tax=Curvivirga sp. TaxID=2856848 RepID=UPI003B5B8B75
MRRANRHHRKENLHNVDLQIMSSVTLEYDDRHRRRIRMIDDMGENFLLDLAHAAYLQDGDLLEFAEGQAILVKAAKEEVLEVTCEDLVQLVRVAWHVGNRHTPVEVLDQGKLRLRYDHVLHHMIEGLGASCEKIIAPFSPEPGAYSGGGHDHAH